MPSKLLTCRTLVKKISTHAGRKDHLKVFALKGKTKANGNTMLYNAPFFNLYVDGSVCMGTVNINIDRQTHLEQFMAQWES
ncbi:E2/UBC family protein D [Mucilaginibacter yixingensis]|uniref:E2/UBC family protein D n=1 Tax=Mucilaginibacter yixingensis TaxID=1295612 RepID=A0A2T5J672_9SPHI|nr:hypothetical protein [Mucilaginibacter yixingensis]PTQ93946.1 E2/UBC family protein D [Mucilaginibacter yixingensis]